MPTDLMLHQDSSLFVSVAESHAHEGQKDNWDRFLWG
jgi:hypothetical protein